MSDRFCYGSFACSTSYNFGVVCACEVAASCGEPSIPMTLVRYQETCPEPPTLFSFLFESVNLGAHVGGKEDEEQEEKQRKIWSNDMTFSYNE